MKDDFLQDAARLFPGCERLVHTRLFDAFDTDGNGHISLAEYVAGMFALRFGTEAERLRCASAARAPWRFRRDSSPLDATIAVIFNMYDLESNGMVTKKDMKRIAVAFAVGACCPPPPPGSIAVELSLFILHCTQPCRPPRSARCAGEVPEWWDLRGSAEDSTRVRVKDMKPLLDTMVEAAMQEVRGIGAATAVLWALVLSASGRGQGH